MAHETVSYRDRIVRTSDVLNGKPVVKGAQIPVDLVLARLAINLDVDELVRNFPGLTHDDVRAVLSYAHDRILADGEAADLPPAAVSPQDFYADVTRRPDVSELMRRLAR